WLSIIAPYSACSAGEITVAAEEPMSGRRASCAGAGACSKAASAAVRAAAARAGRIWVPSIGEMAARRGRRVNGPLIRPRLENRRPRAHVGQSFPARVSGDPSMPEIVLYTSASCGYCVAAKNFLRSRGLEWREVRIDLDPEERTRMVERARRTSVPQIFIG